MDLNSIIEAFRGCGRWGEGFSKKPDTPLSHYSLG